MDLVALIVVLTILLFVLVLSYGLWLEKTRPKGSCVNNLKNIGLAYRTFANDHLGKLPWHASLTNGGTAEFFTNTTQVWRHCLTVSNELTSPRIFHCPSDKRRLMATIWQDVIRRDRNNAISYFIGLDGSEDDPETIFGGDRNLTTNGVAIGSSHLSLATNLTVGFTKDIHTHAGNVVMGDGSVNQFTDARLNEAVQNALTRTKSRSVQLLMP